MFENGDIVIAEKLRYKTCEAPRFKEAVGYLRTEFFIKKNPLPNGLKWCVTQIYLPSGGIVGAAKNNGRANPGPHVSDLTEEDKSDH